MAAAIGWLADTILATLRTGKLAAWIRRAGLADDTEELKREVERVEMVVGAVRGRAAGTRRWLSGPSHLPPFVLAHLRPGSIVTKPTVKISYNLEVF